MATRNHNLRFSFSYYLSILSVLICVHPWFQPPAFAQDEGAREIAVNLAEGRVVICAAKDGIIVATIGEHGESGSRSPAVSSVSPLRAAVMLGAVEWVQPESSDKPIRLDTELPGIIAPLLNTSGQQKYTNAASDIEMIGVAVLERIRQVAGLLHNKIKMGEDEPLIRIVLAGYVPDYGAEVWTIDYHIAQDALGNDIWRTRVLRPSYNQLYPPEKGQPHTLVEVHYPPANRAKDAPELIDLLRQSDPRLAKVRAANEIVGKSVAMVVDGQSQKSAAASDIDFLRGALPAVTSPETKLTMALVDYDKGFRYVLAPPAEDRAPVDLKPREPGAPTLRRKSDTDK
jgi:hypothetical protein